MRATLRFAAVFAVAMCLAAPVRGESIPITAGSLAWTWASGRGPQITLAGDGFTFAGGVTESGGRFDAWQQCRNPECVPGTTVNLFAWWSGKDLPGTATVDDETYTGIGGLAAGAPTLSAQWRGGATIPDDFTGGVITAPFLFAGRFVYDPDGPSELPIRLDLYGSGQTTLTFSPSGPFPGAFDLAAITYEFDANPVPEPASMVLIGTGLAGLAALRRRRTHRAS